MTFTPSPLAGVILIEPKVFGDDRGYFFESYKKPEFVDQGISEEFVQDNQSFSVKNTLRGLHFQKPPFAQSKLVRVLSGEVYDVVVDIRPDSSTFGKWFGVTLSAEKKNMMYIPVGFAHGFCVTSENAEFSYKCGNVYSPEHEMGIRFDDAEIGVTWPIDLASAQVSDKDKVLPGFSEIKKELVW